MNSKYYESEKQSNDDLNSSKEKLKLEIEKIKDLINSQKNQEAIYVLNNCNTLIEEYANSFSKNENIKRIYQKK